MKITKENLEQIIKEEIEAVLNEEEIQYVRNDEYVAKKDAPYRMERCMNMRRAGYATQWVIRNEKGEVVPQGAGGKGRCEWEPGRKPRTVPDHPSFIRENLDKE